MNKIDARKLSPDVLKALRGQALRMRETLQLPWREIARVMGVHVTTVLAWAQRYASEGEAGLESKKPGRAYLSGRTLNLGQEWVLRTIVTSESPSVRGLPFALWNRRAVGQLVQQLFGIDMPIRTVGEYLMRWGYTPQRPSRRALEQKPLDVQHWLQDIYPVIARRAKEESGIIYWADETAVVQDGHWVRGYAPAGQTPELVASSKRFGLTMGAQAHAAQIELFYLPPYAPKLNPDEYLNRDFKTELRSANRCSTASSLRTQATAFMEFLAMMPERMKSYFNHGPVAFAACSG